MLLKTAEKAFICKNNFRSYGIGYADWLNLSHAAIHFQERFRKNPPSNTMLISVVDKENNQVHLRSTEQSRFTKMMTGLTLNRGQIENAINRVHLRFNFLLFVYDGRTM